MRKIFLSLLVPAVIGGLALTILAGCAPRGPSRQAVEMSGYVGGPAGDMVQGRGIPWKTYQRKDGGWVYLWRECRLVYDWHGRQWPRFCETRADIGPDGVVERWNWRGNECPLDGVESGCDPSFWW